MIPEFELLPYLMKYELKHSSHLKVILKIIEFDKLLIIINILVRVELSTIRSISLEYMKSLIIIRLHYYLTSLLSKIATITRTSQAATAPQSARLPYKSVRRLICLASTCCLYY
jgi:hypothetical protein